MSRRCLLTFHCPLKFQTLLLSAPLTAAHKPLCRMGLAGILITFHFFFFLIKVGRACIGSQAHHAMLSNAESMILLPSPAAALTGALLNCCKAHSPHQKLRAFTPVFSPVVCEWIAYVEAFPAVSDDHYYSCAFDSESCSVGELVEIKWVMLQAIHRENFLVWKFNREQSWV